MGDAFPSTIRKPTLGYFSEQLIKPQHRTEMSSGRVLSRPKFTRSRTVFTIGWGALPTAEYETLKTHFAANQGLTFEWTHPFSAVAYTVRYADDSLPDAFAVLAGFHWQITSLKLEED